MTLAVGDAHTAVVGSVTVTAEPLRYRSDDEDSARWRSFPFREGDIVISTRSKSGTTWVQMICALLVFQTPQLPAPLAELSPWLDHEITPLDEVVRRLEAQPHRRFVKTHTPLDGVVIDGRATYIVVARDPRDMYISLYHQGGEHRPRRRTSVARSAGARRAGSRDATATAGARRCSTGSTTTRHRRSGWTRSGECSTTRRTRGSGPRRRTTSCWSTTTTCSPTSRDRCGGWRRCSGSTWTSTAGRRWSRRRRSRA